MQIEVRVHDPSQLPEAIQEQKKIPTKKKLDYGYIDYASLRNLKDQYPEQILVAGLGQKGKKITKKIHHVEPKVIEEPNLLKSAKKYFENKQEQFIESQMEASNQNLGLSSYLNSRDVTPGNLQASVHSKRRNPSQRNKVHSMASELFSIPSDPQFQDKIQKFKNPDFMLYDSILGQSELVYQHVFGKTRTINPKTVHLWKDCLSHEDKSQIYLPVGEQKVEIPYTNARIYPLDVIEKEFKQIYGTGKNKALTAGEEAVIIQSIRRYLTLCKKEPLKIGRKDYDILSDVLKDCKLLQLQNFPLAMKQAQTHFKLLATKWRYSGELNLKDKMVETGISMGKNNFLDLSKHNILTEFLLNNSNISEL